MNIIAFVEENIVERKIQHVLSCAVMRHCGSYSPACLMKDSCFITISSGLCSSGWKSAWPCEVMNDFLFLPLLHGIFFAFLIVILIHNLLSIFYQFCGRGLTVGLPRRAEIRRWQKFHAFQRVPLIQMITIPIKGNSINPQRRKKNCNSSLILCIRTVQSSSKLCSLSIECKGLCLPYGNLTYVCRC